MGDLRRLPAFTADEKCDEGGVEITATNKGDEDFTFTLDGKQTVVAKNGGSVKQLVKVAEDQKYDIKIVGPDNKVLKEFTGVVDCKLGLDHGRRRHPPTTASRRLPRRAVRSWPAPAATAPTPRCT
ncbi:hypothetical protein ACU686_17470 [Yinghuangia aomiensis]